MQDSRVLASYTLAKECAKNWKFRPKHTKFCPKSPDLPLPKRKTTPNTREKAILSIFFKQPLRQNLTRTKLSAKMVVSKVEDFKPTDCPSKILIDAPCSAMGTLRRHPEGAWIKHSDDLVRFPEIQQRLLRSARDMSTVGTVVVYSVCTPFKREGKDVINEVLSEGGLQRLAIKDEDVAHLNCRVDTDGEVLTIPSDIDQPCDAFFIARLKKL